MKLCRNTCFEYIMKKVIGSCFVVLGENKHWIFMIHIMMFINERQDKIFMLESNICVCDNNGCDFLFTRRKTPLFLYHQPFWLNMLRSNRGCVYVCMCVCMCVCVWQCYSSNGWMDFDEIFYKWSDRYLRGRFFSDFEHSKSMTPWRPFCTFSFGHSHGSNFTPIFFKI